MTQLIAKNNFWHQQLSSKSAAPQRRVPQRSLPLKRNEAKRGIRKSNNRQSLHLLQEQVISAALSGCNSDSSNATPVITPPFRYYLTTICLLEYLCYTSLCRQCVWEITESSAAQTVPFLAAEVVYFCTWCNDDVTTEVRKTQEGEYFEIGLVLQLMSAPQAGF